VGRGISEAVMGLLFVPEVEAINLSRETGTADQPYAPSLLREVVIFIYGVVNAKLDCRIEGCRKKYEIIDKDED